MKLKIGRQPLRMVETFIFSIDEFELRYALSVNHRKHTDEAYWEHVEIGLTARCTLPAKVAGRGVEFTLVGQRDFLEPYEWLQDSNWRAGGIGVLELNPDRGRFYAAIPHDSVAHVSSSISTGQFRFIILDGQRLVRGKSLCQSIGFRHDVNLDDY